MTETRFIISGRTPSKKNSKKIILRGRFPLLVPNDDYKKWHREASKELILRHGMKQIEKAESFRIVFYAPDARKFDLTNKAESIMDLLVENGFLLDDSYSCVPRLTLEFGGMDRIEPRAEVYITS